MSKRKISIVGKLKDIYYFLFRAQLRFRCAVSDLIARRTAVHPIPPALMRFRVSESLSIDDFTRIGRGCAKLVAEHLNRCGVALTQRKKILDFGCGCGRTLIWLSTQYPEASWHGVDIDREAVAWCQRHIPASETAAIPPDPPLPFASNDLDAIYCFSVFTHLDESLQDIWLKELGRVLKPGGILLVTVHGEYAANWRLDQEGRNDLSRSGFLHRTSSKLKGIVPTRYHTSWHTAPYILKRLEHLVGVAEYHIVDGGMQDIAVAVKAAKTLAVSDGDILTTCTP